jgi:hypothetical protein
MQRKRRVRRELRATDEDARLTFPSSLLAIGDEVIE